MFPIPLVYRYLGVALLLAAVFGAGLWKGYSAEHDKLVTYRAQVAQAAADQAAIVKQKDQQIKENANEADKNLAVVANGINAYYRDHPVRVLDKSGCGTLPQAAGNPQGPDGATASGDAPTYASPYNPEEVENIAARLYELQQLLLKDGVSVQ